MLKYLRPVTFLILIVLSSYTNANDIRIVSLAPHITDNLISAGLANNIIGVLDSDMREELSAPITIVGAYSGLDFEEVIQLKPDLIFIGLNWGQAAWQEKLESLGFTVVVSHIDTLDDIANEVETYASRYGHLNDSIISNIKHYRQSIKDLRNKTYTSTPDIFLEIWPQPLMTVGRTNFITQALSLCGARNIFSEEISKQAATISREAVFEKQPDAVIALNDVPLDWANIPSYPLNDLSLSRPSLSIIQGIHSLCTIVETTRTP